MSVPVAGEWLWKRVIFVNPQPLANTRFKRSEAVGIGRLGQRITLAAFSFAFDRRARENLPLCIVRTTLPLRARQRGEASSC
jgi:hypothetical protein